MRQAEVINIQSCVLNRLTSILPQYSRPSSPNDSTSPSLQGSVIDCCNNAILVLYPRILRLHLNPEHVNDRLEGRHSLSSAITRKPPTHSVPLPPLSVISRPLLPLAPSYYLYNSFVPFSANPLNSPPTIFVSTHGGERKTLFGKTMIKGWGRGRCRSLYREG